MSDGTVGGELFGWRLLLEEHYPGLDEDGGVDLDGDGMVAGVEIADADDNFVIDEEEAKAFCAANRDALAKEVGFLKSSRVLSPDNPLHSVILYESQIFSFDERDVAATYARIDELLDRVEEIDGFQSQWNEIYPVWSNDGRQSPVDVMDLFSQALHETGALYGIGSVEDHLFITSVLIGRHECATSAFLFVGIGHEMGWPVFLSSMPTHAIIKWSDGEGNEVNLDPSNGKSPSDAYYAWHFNIDQRSIDNGIFLSKYSRAKFDSAILSNIALLHARDSEIERGMEIARSALELDPKNTQALMAYGGMNMELSAIYSDPAYAADAIEAFKRYHEYDPRCYRGYVFEAQTYRQIGDYERAIGSLMKALELYPRHRNGPETSYGSKVEFLDYTFIIWNGIINTLKIYEGLRVYSPMVEMEGYRTLGRAYAGRGATYLKKRDYDKAIADLKKATRISPTPFAWSQRGHAELGLGKHADAVESFREALKLAPGTAETYLGLGAALTWSESYAEAIGALQKSIEMEPLSITYSYLGTAHLGSVGDPRKDLEAVRERLEKSKECFEKALELDPDNWNAAEGVENVGELLGKIAKIDKIL